MAAMAGDGELAARQAYHGARPVSANQAIKAFKQAKKKPVKMCRSCREFNGNRAANCLKCGLEGDLAFKNAAMPAHADGPFARIRPVRGGPPAPAAPLDGAAGAPGAAEVEAVDQGTGPRGEPRHLRAIPCAPVRDCTQLRVPLHCE
jgi:hypothetical protein